MNNSTYPTEMAEPASPPGEDLRREVRDEMSRLLKLREPSCSDLLVEWRDELDTIRTRLAEIGERGESFEYNILSASALRLMECISDLSYIEGWQDCAKSGGANE